jgi:serine/threonine-protein kinase
MGGSGVNRTGRTSDTHRSLAVVPDVAATRELARTARVFLDVLAASWIAVALLVDPLLGARTREIELRLLGLALIALARLLLMQPRISRHVVLITIAVAASGSIGCAAAIAVAQYGNDAAAGLLAAVPVLAGSFGLALIVLHRQWQLRHDLYESRRLGRYRLMLPIGHGGMNDVWLAWDEHRRREVALKLLRTPGTAASTRERFAREAEINKRVRSPHTVRIYDFGVSDDGFAYIAQEYLRGMDLDAMVSGYGPVEPRRAIHLIRQACEGLGAAHRCGVIHRDIKPANLHCADEKGAEDLVRILDFGVARRIDEDEPSLDGAVIGTPAYMSPEGFRAEGATPASDVYALGATFYYAVTGVPPIDADSPAAFKQAHQFAPVVPPSLRSSGVDVPRPIEKVILRCLAKAPADRYPDAAALGAAIDDATRALEPWTRDDAARWWHQVRLGRIRIATKPAEHTTDVEVVGGRSRRASRNVHG